MRVSTYGSYLQGVRLLQELQSTLTETQVQVATGRRLLRPSDDPIAAARSLGFRESIGRLEQFDRNSNTARARLEQEESALQSVTNVLQRVRELAIRANNATETKSSRRQVAVELEQLLADLVQLGNQRDGNGRYLFAGTKDGSVPVSNSPTGFIYNGDEGQRLIQIGEARQVYDGDSGAEVFFNIKNGNGVFRTTPSPANAGTGVLELGNVIDPSSYDKRTYTLRFLDPDNYEVVDPGGIAVTSGPYTAGQTVQFQGIEFTLSGAPATGDEFVIEPSTNQSMFQTVQNMIDVLDTAVASAESQAALVNQMNLSIQEVDQAIENVGDIRTQIGIRLSAIESQTDGNSASALLAKQAISELEDLDYAEALSRLSLQVTNLEAAQRSFAATQQLSLFDYI